MRAWHCCHRPRRIGATVRYAPRERWPCDVRWSPDTLDPKRVVCVGCGHTVACHLDRSNREAATQSLRSYSSCEPMLPPHNSKTPRPEPLRPLYPLRASGGGGGVVVPGVAVGGAALGRLSSLFTIPDSIKVSITTFI
jgi:hypothetical protein